MNPKHEPEIIFANGFARLTEIADRVHGQITRDPSRYLWWADGTDCVHIVDIVTGRDCVWQEDENDAASQSS